MLALNVSCGGTEELISLVRDYARPGWFRQLVVCVPLMPARCVAVCHNNVAWREAVPLGGLKVQQWLTADHFEIL